jgi:type IV fimbrial biogenesis protein FimT
MDLRIKVNCGFSLVELMVVIMVAAVLMAIGVPSYRYVTNSNRMSGEVNGLLGDLQFARSEAIKEGVTVTVCPSSVDQKSCVASSTWDRGWIVTSSVLTPPVLRVQQPFANTNDSFTSDNNVVSVTFDRDGFAHTTPVPPKGYFTVKLTTIPNTAQWMRCVEVPTVGGMITTERNGTDDCQ